MRNSVPKTSLIATERGCLVDTVKAFGTVTMNRSLNGATGWDSAASLLAPSGVVGQPSRSSLLSVRAEL